MNSDPANSPEKIITENRVELFLCNNNTDHRMMRMAACKCSYVWLLRY